MFKFHYEHNERDLRNMFFSTSHCNSFDIYMYKYYLSRRLYTYQNIYIRVLQIRSFLPKSEIRVKFGIYNSDMWRFGAISHACFKNGGCPKLTSRENDRLAAASFFMIFINQNYILSVSFFFGFCFSNYNFIYITHVWPYSFYFTMFKCFLLCTILWHNKYNSCENNYLNVYMSKQIPMPTTKQFAYTC